MKQYTVYHRLSTPKEAPIFDSLKDAETYLNKQVSGNILVQFTGGNFSRTAKTIKTN